MLVIRSYTMKIKKDDLMYYKDYVTYNDGYIIVYYYEKYHEAPRGLYAKNIEDFIGFLKTTVLNVKVQMIFYLYF